MLWLCEGCGTLYAVGLFRCPHCHDTNFHEFGSKPEDEEHPMAKISLHRGVSDAIADAEAAEAAALEAPEESPLVPADEPEPAAARPADRAPRQEWLDWAAASGYHGPCLEALTVPQLKALPDGPPDYDDDGLLRTPDDASNETAQAIGVYNGKALDLYGETTSQVAEGTAEGSDAEDEEPAGETDPADEEVDGAEDGPGDGADEG